MFWDAIKRRMPRVLRSLLLRAFDLFPVGPDLVDILNPGRPENMRMSADQLVDEMTRDLVEIKRAAFARQLAMKHYLQQQVAQLFSHLDVVAGFNGID